MYGKIKGDCPIFCNQVGKIIGEDEMYYKLLLPTGQAVYVQKEHIELIPEPINVPRSNITVTDKLSMKEETRTFTTITTTTRRKQKEEQKEEPKEETLNVDTTENS